MPGGNFPSSPCGGHGPRGGGYQGQGGLPPAGAAREIVPRQSQGAREGCCWGNGPHEIIVSTAVAISISPIRYVEGFLPTPGDFYKNRIFIKTSLKPTFKPSKAIPNHVKLNFLSAALDPQEMVQRYWSYEGFMPIFWFGLIVWICESLGF